MQTIKIIIADDHKLVRETWAYVLNSDPRFEVIGDFGDSEAAICESLKVCPDVVLMDINIEPISGFEAAERITKNLPATRVLAVSMHTQPVYAKKMFEAGARGYITKNSPQEELMTAIVAVAEGRKYICNTIKNNISSLMFGEEDSIVAIQTLTDREKQIICLVKEGMSSKRIAASLDIKYRTVEVHRHNILKKLKLKNSASLVNFSYANIL